MNQITSFSKYQGNVMESRMDPLILYYLTKFEELTDSKSNQDKVTISCFNYN